MILCPCPRCRAPFTPQIRNGLKVSRKCKECRLADQMLDNKAKWLRKGIKGCLSVLKGLSEGSGRRLGHIGNDSGGSKAQARGVRLTGQKRLRRSKIRPRKLWLKVDKVLTSTASFANPRSCILLDGRFNLYGEDMCRMREMVLQRDGYKCKVCQATCQLEIDHILSRGKHPRDDRPMNLQTLCKPCHRQKHSRILHWSRKEKG